MSSSPAAAPSADATTVEAAMLALKGTDNALIAHASSFLKALVSKPTCGPVMYSLMQSSPHNIVRQLAAVLLRPKIIALWNRVDANARTTLKTALLHRLAEEPVRLVRKAIVSLIAALGKILMPGGNWPELIDAMAACSASTDPELREMGLVLLKELQEAMGFRFSPMMETVKPWVGAALADSNVKVQRAGLRCLGLLLLNNSDPAQLSALRDMLPALIQITQQCMDARIDEPVVETLDAIRSLIEGDSAILHPFIVPLAQFFMSVMTHDSLEESTQAEASECIMALIEMKPKTLLKKGVIDALFPLIMSGLATYDVEEEREMYREAKETGIDISNVYGSSPWHTAGRILDSICLYLPAKVVFAKLTEHAGPGISDPSPAIRQAALCALGIAAEGCHHVFDENLDAMLDLVIRTGENDSAAMVHEAAMYTLAQFAEFVQPAIMQYHDVFLPAVFRMLALDPSTPVVERACFAIENFVDVLDHDVLQLYIDPLMSKLGELLSTPGLDIIVEETVVGCIASVAAAAAHHLTPFLPALNASLGPMLAMTDARHLRLRSAATEALGFAAVAVGKDAYRPFLAAAMTAVGEGLQHDSLQLAEKTFMFYGSMAEAFGEEFAPYIEQVVPVLESWIEMEDTMEVRGMYADDEDEDGGVGDALGQLESDDDDDDDGAGTGTGGGDGDATESEDEGGDEVEEEEGIPVGNHVRMTTHTACLEMKTAAVTALAFMAEHCPLAFAPHVQKAVALFQALQNHFFTDLAQRAITGLNNCITCMVKLRPMVPSEEEGLWVFDEHVQQVYDTVITDYILKIRQTTDKKVAASICTAINHLVKSLGVPAILHHHAAIMKQLLKIGREKAACQLVLDDGEGGAIDSRDHLAEAGEGEESMADTIAAAMAGSGMRGGEGGGDGGEEEDHDELIVDATETVVSIAKVMGDSFSVYLPSVMKVWRRFTKPSRALIDQHMAIGMYADLSGGLEDTFKPYVLTVLPLVLAGAVHENREMRRNSLFALGMFIEHATDVMRPQLQSVFEVLYAAFSLGRGKPSDDPLVDNACGALARAVMCVPEAVPLSFALPAMMSVLPLRADFVENHTVFRCLMPMLVSQHPEMVKCIPAFVPSLAVAVMPGTRCLKSTVDDVIAPGVRNFLLTATPENKASFESAVSSLPAPEQAAIAALCA